MDAAGLVANGVALLDRVRPDWYRVIDRDRINVGSASDCPVGQIFGDYTGGLSVLFPDVLGDPDSDQRCTDCGCVPDVNGCECVSPYTEAVMRAAQAHGFDTSFRATYHALTVAWRDAVTTRRAVATVLALRARRG